MKNEQEKLQEAVMASNEGLLAYYFSNSEFQRFQKVWMQ